MGLKIVCKKKFNHRLETTEDLCCYVKMMVQSFLRERISFTADKIAVFQLITFQKVLL